MAVPSLPGGKPDILYVSDKDPDYVYRWVNNKDMLYMSAMLDGFEVVEGEDPAFRALKPLNTLGQSTETPGGGVARMRGDLVLCRMRREVYESTLGEQDRLARERQEATIDTLVQEANEHAHRALRNVGVRETKTLVFRDDKRGLDDIVQPS